MIQQNPTEFCGHSIFYSLKAKMQNSLLTPRTSGVGGKINVKFVGL